MSSRYMTPVLLLIGALVIGSYLLSASNSATPQSLQAAIVDSKPVVATSGGDGTAAATATRAALSRTKAEQESLLNRARQTTAKLEKEIPAEQRQWQDEIVPLLRNDRGRALAASTTHTQAFFREFNAPKAAPETIASLRRQMDFLRPSLEQAAADPSSTYLPDKEFLSKLDDITRQADDALRSYRVGREAIERLLRVARAENPSPNGPLLEGAVQAGRDNEESQRAVAEQARLEQQRGDDALIAARAEEEARKQKQADDEARERREAAAAERRRQMLEKASDPDFQHAFSPFLASGSTRIGGGKYLMGEHPGAFMDIQRNGGFQSRERLKFLMLHPDGAWGRRDGLKQGWEAAIQRFDDFQGVARIWVDQCKLLNSPEDAGKPCTPKLD